MHTEKTQVSLRFFSFLHSITSFNYCNQLRDKFAFVFVLRRAFQIKIAEDARQLYAVFLCVCDKFFAGIRDFFISTVVKEIALSAGR